MALPDLPSDDLPPPPTPLDHLLRLRLEKQAGYHFLHTCDRITQSILAQCQWGIKTDAEVLTLVITCPDIEIYWYIISALPQFANALERITSFARVVVNPPPDKGRPFEVHVDEIPTDL